MRVAWLVVAALALVPGWLVGCNSNEAKDDHPLSERDGNATHTWSNLLSVITRVQRYALYQKVGPSQLHLWSEIATAPELAALRAAARENENGIARTMLQDAHLAIYYDPAIGHPLAILPGETIDDAVRATFGTTLPGRDGAGSDAGGSAERKPQDRAVSIPRVQVGTICLYTDDDKVVTLPVVRYGRSGAALTQSTGLYIGVEGRAGDMAWYRLGDIGRSYLLVADRDFR